MNLERTLAICVYNHCNMCNITIYFCNIHMKHLQHISKTSETIETYFCNMHFQRNVSLLLGKIEAHRCVVFTGGSRPATLVGGGPTAVAARCGREALAARAAGRPRPHDLERAAARLGEGNSAPRLAGTAAERRDSQPVRLSLSAKSASHSIVFFSHNKSENSTFSHGLSAKQTSC
jgi:hypothetical protein